MIQLNQDQKSTVLALKWLIDGPRASGRSFAIAYYLVEKAVVTHQPVALFDHTTVDSQAPFEQVRRTNRYIVSTCEQIKRENYPDYVLQYNITHNTILVWKPV